MNQEMLIKQLGASRIDGVREKVSYTGNQLDDLTNSRCLQRLLALLSLCKFTENE